MYVQSNISNLLSPSTVTRKLFTCHDDHAYSPAIYFAASGSLGLYKINMVANDITMIMTVQLMYTEHLPKLQLYINYLYIYHM